MRTVDVIGSATVDVLAWAPALDGLGRLAASDALHDEFTMATVTVLDRCPVLRVGGNGAALALALASFAVPTRLWCTIGDDSWGAWLTGGLGASGVTLMCPVDA